MTYFRPSAERGRANFGWLDSRHTFSFGQYYDPKHMGFSTLRVINEDRVAPGGGFPPHGHRDMEIISVVLDGGLAHEDSMGNGSTIRPGDVQRMSAGTGVRHSEFNASDTDPVHFLQIWLLPGAEGVEPGYAERHFAREDKLNRARLIVSPDGRDGSLSMNQDAFLYEGIVEAGHSMTHDVRDGRAVWLQVIDGDVTANGVRMEGGDGLGLEGAEEVRLEATAESHFLLFELEPAR